MYFTRKLSTDIIIHLSGRIDHSKAEEVEEYLVKVMRENTDANLILNLVKVEYLSSSGLRIFLTSKKVLEGRKKKLKLCEPSDSVMKVLNATNMTEHLNIYDSERSAYEDT